MKRYTYVSQPKILLLGISTYLYGNKAPEHVYEIVIRTAQVKGKTPCDMTQGFRKNFV